MPSPSCLNLASGTIIYGPTVIATGTGIPLVLTAADTNLCASVNGLTSGVTSYSVATPLSSYIANDESAVTIDLGQTVPLTAYVSGGAPPYTYAWYVGPTCGGGPVLGTHATYKATPGATTSYVVLVTDSSMGTPATDCEAVAVTVNPTFVGTFAIDGISSGIINGQSGSPSFTAIVTFTGGTNPWYGVTIYSGTDSLCTGDTTVVAHADDVTASEAILSFPEPSAPSSTIFYCATLTDGAGNSISLPASGIGIQVNTSPALSAPTISIYPTSAEYNINYPVGALPMTATVTWAGGVAPYFVVLTSGSSSSCAAPDNNHVTYTVLSGGALWTGLPVSAYASYYAGLGYTVATTTGVTMTLMFTQPGSNTYYCAIVFDSSAPTSSQTYTAAGALFTVEGLFASNAPKLSSTAVEALSPLYEGFPITASVTWSGGTGPYDVSLFYGTVVAGVCVPAASPLVVTTPGFNPQTGITGTSASFTFLAPNTPSVAPYCYFATVTDASFTAVGGATLFSTLSVATYLGTPGMVIPTTGIDTGQTTSITITVNGLTGGNSPYTVTLYEGATAATCTTKVTGMAAGYSNPATTPGPTVNFKFTSPSTSSYFCASIADSSLPPSTAATTPAPWTIVSPPTVTITGAPEEEIAAGSATTLVAVGSGGVTPYTSYQWFIGTATCAPADAVTAPSAIGSSYNTGVITTNTVYSVQLVDGSTGTPASIGIACATILVTANNGPIGVATVASGTYAGLIYVTNPISPGTGAGGVTVIDSDSASVVTTIPLTFGGCEVSPYGVAVDSTTNTVYVTGSTGPTSDLAQPAFACIGTPNDGVVLAIDLTTNTQVMALGLGAGTNPEGIALNHALGQVYIAENGINSVAVYSLVLVPLGTVSVGPGPMGVAVDPTSYNVYVTDNSGNTLSVLQPTLNPPPLFVVTTVNVGFEPVGVAVNPANGNVLVANSGDGTVSVVSGTTLSLLATIHVGGSPQGIDISGTTAYVANAATNTVTMINLATNTVITPTIPVGSSPMGVAFDAPNGIIIVTNSASNTVSVISATTNTVVATIVVP